MKKILMMAIAIFMTFSASMSSIHAVSASATMESSQMPSAEELVEMVAQQLNTPEIQKELLQGSDGAVLSLKATSRGKALILDMAFNKDVNFENLTNNEKNELRNIFSSNLAVGLGTDLISFFKSTGISIEYNLKDQYGHNIQGKF